MPDDYRSPLSGPFRIFFLGLRSWLDTLSDGAVWRLVIGSMVGLAVVNFFTQQMGIRLGPLYLLPISLACWRLNFQIGLGLGFLAALTVAVTTYIVSEDVPVIALAGNLALNAFALGMIAGIVVTARHSIEQERFSARRDSITGALTRTAFEQQARTMMNAASAQGRPLLLAYLDLDGFKAINDRHGHEAGDRVLQRFGAEGRAALRQEDCFARLGGDEFAVLLSLSSVEAAQETAEKLHERFTAALAAASVEVTCSMGAFIVSPDSRASLDELMREADRLMYAVKHGGKNGVRFALSAPPLDGDLPLFAGLVETSAALRRSIQPFDTREVPGGW